MVPTDVSLSNVMIHRIFSMQDDDDDNNNYFYLTITGNSNIYSR